MTSPVSRQSRWSHEAASDRNALPSPDALGLDPEAVEALCARAERDTLRHEGVGSQLAIGRGGRLAVFRSFGCARFGGHQRPPGPTDLFAVFSVTKALLSSAVWKLLESERLQLSDRVVDFIPEFGEGGKEAILVEHLLTHSAGLPGARLDPPVWEDSEARVAAMAGWELEWEPGSRFVYHGLSSMWILAELITRRSGVDYRELIRARILEPLGLHDLFLGLPAAENTRVAEIVGVGELPESDGQGVSSVDAPAIEEEDLPAYNRPEWRAVGVPGGGAISTAAAIALFYQALLADASGTGPGVWRGETLADAWKVRDPERIDPMTGKPAMRALGVVVAGESGRVWRGFAETCSAKSIGHMGMGGQVAWADPETGLSFAFLTSGADRDPARQGGRNFRLSTLANECIRE